MNDTRAFRVELTNMCMITDGDRVLVENRTDPDWPGIVFPGGHVEKDESITDSVIREIREETGLTIESPKLIGIQDWQYNNGGRYLVFYFKANKFTGTLTASEEGELKWVPIRELKKEDFADGFEDIYRVFENENLTELYHAEDTGWSPVFY